MMSETASDPHSPTTGVSVGTGTTVHPHAPRLRAPRTIPPWIDSYEVRYGEPTDAAMGSMYRPPPQAATPQHNNTPSEPHRRMSRDGYVYPDDLALTEAKRSRVTLQTILRKGGAERGRKWDHLRSAEPVIVSKFLTPETGPFWRSFVRSSAYGHLPNEEAQVVSVDELDKMQPGFNNPADVPRSNDLTRSRATRTAALYKRVWSGILEHPLVPLAFRLTVLVTSVIALALGIKILESEEGEADADRGAEWTQAVVAIVVDSVAIPYIGYMTWDEYTGKPLGLRTATSKISLVLMDLFFIIFKSASTTLAFDALVYHAAYIPVVERYSRALAAFQTVGLISWTMTFTVNVFRLVQRLGGGEEDTHMWGGYSAHG